MTTTTSDFPVFSSIHVYSPRSYDFNDRNDASRKGTESGFLLLFFWIGLSDGFVFSRCLWPTILFATAGIFEACVSVLVRRRHLC